MSYAKKGKFCIPGCFAETGKEVFDNGTGKVQDEAKHQLNFGYIFCRVFGSVVVLCKYTVGKITFTGSKNSIQQTRQNEPTAERMEKEKR